LRVHHFRAHEFANPKQSRKALILRQNKNDAFLDGLHAIHSPQTECIDVLQGAQTPEWLFLRERHRLLPSGALGFAEVDVQAYGSTLMALGKKKSQRLALAF
jgi:hypothetical protein